MFTWYPIIIQQCTYLLHRTLSDAIFIRESGRECTQWISLEQTENVFNRDPVKPLVSEQKVSTSYSGTRTIPEFWLEHLEKDCVDISAQLVPYTGKMTATKHEHRLN